MSITYTVRRPGAAAWQEKIPTARLAKLEAGYANSVVPGHQVIAHSGSQALVLADCPECEDSRAVMAGGRLQLTCGCGRLHREAMGLAEEGGPR